MACINGVALLIKKIFHCIALYFHAAIHAFLDECINFEFPFVFKINPSTLLISINLFYILYEYNIIKTLKIDL